MEALDGLSGSSDDGNVQSQLFALTQMCSDRSLCFLKPADVYSLSLTCKHFKENGKLIMGTMMRAQLDCVMEDRTRRFDQTGTLRSFTFTLVYDDRY